jgi:muramoyltetrapeptide carboxypeptidase LdcA involved in peptidoglycan recycling
MSLSKILLHSNYAQYSTKPLSSLYQSSSNLFGKDFKKVGNILTNGSSLLNKGDKIGVVSDTILSDGNIKLDKDTKTKIIQYIESMGFEPVFDAHHYNAKYFRWQGTTEDRANHIVNLIEKKKVQAIWPLFGKGGDSSVAEYLYSENYIPSSKIVNLGAFSHHADMGLLGSYKNFYKAQINATQLAYVALDLVPKENQEAYKMALVSGLGASYKELMALNPKALYSNTMIGKLYGGNLGVILANASKKWFPDLKDSIFYIEQFNVDPHEMDRQLHSAFRIAKEHGAKGILLGRLMTNKNADGSKTDSDLRSIVSRLLFENEDLAIYQSNLFGHGYSNLPLGIGGAVELDGQNEMLTTEFLN